MSNAPYLGYLTSGLHEAYPPSSSILSSFPSPLHHHNPSSFHLPTTTMCFSEYFAVIPLGCRAKNQHAHGLKDIIPCFESIFLAMARNADAGGDPATLNITLCSDKDRLRIDCFRNKLEVKALQTKDPYCPVCLGEKTMAEALMVQVGLF